MNLSIQNYLFLSHCLPLPLSTLKIIEENIYHPFHQIKELKFQAIKDELVNLNKEKNVKIREIPIRAEKACNLIDDNIFEKISERLAEWSKLGILMLSYFDSNYPLRLKNIQNPPKLIFIRGNPNIDYNKSISIVGTRNPTEYGKDMAFKIGYRFAKNGYVVVNGFAKGIDIEALKGGLEAGGKIIGVLGSGVLKPYPKENSHIFSKILKNKKGFFISEQLPNKNVTKSSLATRNRISSALGLGNIFIEGNLTSGTKWQLKFGKEQNKPIIVLNPKEISKETELPRKIIKSEKDVFIIEKIDDVDHLAKSLIKSKKNKATSIKDFI